MKPRIVIAPVSYPTLADPVTGVFVQDQAQILAQDFDVTVLAVHPVSIKSLAVVRRGEIVQETDGPVRVFRIFEPSWPTFESIAAHMRRSPDGQAIRHLAIFTRALKRGIAECTRLFGPPAIIHAHMAQPAGAACIRAAAGSIPVLITEHTTPSTAHTKTPWKRGVSQHAYTLATHVLAVSPWLAEEITREFPTIVPTVCPNVIREDMFGLTTKTTPANDPCPEFLCVCSLVPRKGVDCLIRAAHLLAHQRPTAWHITIAGRGPLLTSLMQQAKDGPARDRITFIPSPHRQGVARLMQGCSALIMPSELETFGLVACEANACGKPVLAAASGGAQFTITSDTGWLFPPGDADALASAMNRLVESGWHASPEEVRSSVLRRFGVAPFLASIHRAYGPLPKRSAQSSPSRTLH